MRIRPRARSSRLKVLITWTIYQDQFRMGKRVWLEFKYDNKTRPWSRSLGWIWILEICKYLFANGAHRFGLDHRVIAKYTVHIELGDRTRLLVVGVFFATQLRGWVGPLRENGNTKKTWVRLLCFVRISVTVRKKIFHNLWNVLVQKILVITTANDR